MFADIKGKIVLVTGASSGIGAAVARGFGEAGAKVAVHCHSNRAGADRVAGDIAAAGGQARVFACDLTKRGAARRLVEDAADAFGGIDILINNAGGMVKRVRIEDMDEEIFDRAVDLNVRAVVMACSAAAIHLRRRGGGAIINVTSMAARTGGSIGASLYASTKGFISTFTHGLARELAPDNIRVNAVSPGVIDTPFHAPFATAEQLETARQQIPLKRLGSPEECVGIFLALASPSASNYITGQIIEVGGGLLMG